MLAAAGRGTRLGEDKIFSDVGGRPLLALTLDAAAHAGVFTRLVLVTGESNWERARGLAADAGFSDIDITAGGETRQESVYRGLLHCRDAEVICVHDAARPLTPPRVFRAVVTAALSAGAATAAIPAVDTVKRVEGNRVVETPQRASLVYVQTPQAFLGDVLRTAHERARSEGFDADDDCALVERGGGRVNIVEGDPLAFKVTRPIDLVLVRSLNELSRASETAS